MPQNFRLEDKDHEGPSERRLINSSCLDRPSIPSRLGLDRLVGVQDLTKDDDTRNFHHVGSSMGSNSVVQGAHTSFIRFSEAKACKETPAISHALVVVKGINASVHNVPRPLSEIRLGLLSDRLDSFLPFLDAPMAGQPSILLRYRAFNFAIQDVRVATTCSQRLCLFSILSKFSQFRMAENLDLLIRKRTLRTVVIESQIVLPVTLPDPMRRLVIALLDLRRG